jgi:hypothetical protein
MASSSRILWGELMAGYNEILVGRFNRFFQRHFGIKGPASVAQLSSDVQPVFSIFNGAENRHLEGWQRYASNNDILGVAAQTNAVRLRNPNGSGVLAVIESLVIGVSPNAAAFDRIQQSHRGNGTNSDLSSATNAFPYDRRGDKFSTCLFSFDNAGNQQGLGPDFIIPLLANTPYQHITHEDQEIVLSPGEWKQWFNLTAQTRLTVSLVWRERPIEEGEQAVVFP